MGYILSESEQRYIQQLYGYKAQYRCDYEECGLPIFVIQIPVVDPKGGYYKRTGGDLFSHLKAKRTYHQSCDKARRGLTSNGWDGTMPLVEKSQMKDFSNAKKSRKHRKGKKRRNRRE